MIIQKKISVFVCCCCLFGVFIYLFLFSNKTERSDPHISPTLSEQVLTRAVEWMTQAQANMALYETQLRHVQHDLDAYRAAEQATMWFNGNGR